ncbi:MAG TPA: hypothetical protein PK985_05320 [Bacillota bacterium]|jgi:YD repeat-containing protein|nr:hypothetical protein [Bacillota bacterium]
MFNRIISITMILILAVIAFTGCDRSADSSYKEVIKDGKVEIDGIFYDIKSITQTAYKYDDNGNILEEVTTSNGSKTRIEYTYENGRLIEERLFSNDGVYSYSDVSLTKYYYYEDDRLMKARSVTSGGLEAVTEYSYGNNTETQVHYNSDGSISFIQTAYLDDDGKIVKGLLTEADGEVMDTRTFHYDNGLLVKAIVERDGVITKAFNYEYNNIGDIIMEYNIFYDKAYTLFAVFYDYEYNENSLPETVTTYRVQSPIAEENIRDGCI